MILMFLFGIFIGVFICVKYNRVILFVSNYEKLFIAVFVLFIAIIYVYLATVFTYNYWQLLIGTVSYKDWDLIIKLVTGIAPTIAAIIVFYTWYSNRDYKNDYYKKILDKRIEAYSKLNYFVSKINIMDSFIIPDKGTSKSGMAMPYFTCFNTMEMLSNTIDELSKLGEHLVWINQNTKSTFFLVNNIISDAYIIASNPGKEEMMNMFLTDIIPKKNYDKTDEKYLTIALGIRNQKRMSFCISKLKKMIHDDYKSMDNIKKFLDYNI